MIMMLVVILFLFAHGGTPSRLLAKQGIAWKTLEEIRGTATLLCKSCPSLRTNGDR